MCRSSEVRLEKFRGQAAEVEALANEAIGQAKEFCGTCIIQLNGASRVHQDDALVYCIQRGAEVRHGGGVPAVDEALVALRGGLMSAGNKFQQCIAHRRRRFSLWPGPLL